MPSVKDIAGGADVGKEAVGSCGRLFWGQDASPRGSAHWPWGSPCPSLAPDAVRTLSLWLSQVLGLLETPPSGSSHLRARPSPSSVCSPDTRGHLSGETPSSMRAVRALDELDLGTSVMSTTFSLEQASHPHLCPPRGPPADCGWWEGLTGKSSGHGESYLASDLHFFFKKDLPLASSSVLSDCSCSNSLASSNPPPPRTPSETGPKLQGFPPRQLRDHALPSRRLHPTAPGRAPCVWEVLRFLRVQACASSHCRCSSCAPDLILRF